MQRASQPRSSHRAAAVAGGLLLALLLAGCRSSAAPAPTPTPTALPPTPTAEVGALPLVRFHYVASLTLRETGVDAGGDEVVISTEGNFESPDRHAFIHIIDLGEDTVIRSAVIIGEDAWLQADGEPWREAARDDPELADLLAVAFTATRPQFLGGPEFRLVQESVRRLPSTEELVNGVATNHYQVGQAGREFVETFLVPEELVGNLADLAWDLWLAEEGAWPVRLLASTIVINPVDVLQELDLEAPVHWELRIDISRPNDPELSVMAPKTVGDE